MDGSQQTKKALTLSAGTTLLYVAVMWQSMEKTGWAGFQAMSVAFMFATPLAIGALVNHWAEEADRGTLLNLVLLPACFSSLGTPFRHTQPNRNRRAHRHRLEKHHPRPPHRARRDPLGVFPLHGVSRSRGSYLVP